MASVLRATVLFHDLEFSSWTDVLTLSFIIVGINQNSLFHQCGKPSWPRCSRTSPNHDAATFLFYRFSKVLNALFSFLQTQHFSGFLIAALPCILLLFGVLLMADSWMLTLASVENARTITLLLLEWSLLFGHSWNESLIVDCFI